MESQEGIYRGRTALVVGAARTGVATAEFLLAQGARVILTDTKSEESLSSRITPLRRFAPAGGELQLELGGHRSRSFRVCDFVVLSPGVPPSLPELEESRRAGIPVLGEVELASRHLKGKLLGITGTNGKTTTTTLVAELLRGAGLKGFAAGNIGTPLIRYVSRSSSEDIYATEISSFQLETVQEFHPAVASILNITPNHLDRYAGFEEYAAAKRRIFMNQEAGDFAVLNRDNPCTAAMAREVPSVPVLFSTKTEVRRGTVLRGDRLIYRDGEEEHELLARGDIRLRGIHNVENVLAAATIALLAGAAPDSMRETVRVFRGVEHRLEHVAEIDAVEYVNDSKATSVDATIRSVEALPGRIFLILGGRDKAGNFADLRPVVEKQVKRVILMGEAAGKIRDALRGAAELSDAATLPEAVALCHTLSEPGDIVLLAPACASFDMFEDFEHRGRVFKESVLRLRKED